MCNKIVNKEEVFLMTLLEYLETENESELARLLNPAKVIFDYGNEFSYKRWNQRKCYIEIKVPISVKKKVEIYKDTLSKFCSDIFEEDEEYGYAGIYFGVLQQTISVKTEEGQVVTTEVLVKNHIFNNLITKINKYNLDPIESTYINEACRCAINEQRLAAATMLGCAAECLLLQLCKAYLGFLKNGNGSQTEIDNFEKNVVNADKAHKRLDSFKKTIQNKEKLFEKLGLENANLHFTFLDLIRQVRNESGHPTGIIISDEDLSTIFANYQLLIERVHPLIIKLPTAKAI